VTVDVNEILGDGVEQVIIAVPDVKLKVGIFASAVNVTFPIAEIQPVIVLVTVTINIPLPPILGLLIDVLLIVPVDGAVQL
jgi:hypothetical protein